MKNKKSKKKSRDCSVRFRETQRTHREQSQNKTKQSFALKYIVHKTCRVKSELFSLIFEPLKYIADRTMFSSYKHPITEIQKVAKTKILYKQKIHIRKTKNKLWKTR